jgi:hypothetical protein
MFPFSPRFDFVCVCIQLSARRLVGSPYSDGTRCARTRTHIPAPMHSTPHTTTARHIRPGVEWGRVASSFPPPYFTQPGNDEVHYLAKLGSTNLIYLHHPQADYPNNIQQRVKTVKVHLMYFSPFLLPSLPCVQILLQQFQSVFLSNSDGDGKVM